MRGPTNHTEPVRQVLPLGQQSMNSSVCGSGDLLLVGSLKGLFIGPRHLQIRPLGTAFQQRAVQYSGSLHWVLPPSDPRSRGLAKPLGRGHSLRYFYLHKEFPLYSPMFLLNLPSRPFSLQLCRCFLSFLISLLPSSFPPSLLPSLLPSFLPPPCPTSFLDWVSYSQD